MIKKSIYKFYYFGTCFRYLQDAKIGRSLRGPSRGGVVDNIERLKEGIDELGLTVTRGAADILGLQEIQTTLSQEPNDSRLTEAQASQLSDIMNRLRITCDSEIGELTAFIVTPKRLAVSQLLDDVESLLGPNVYSLLPQIAQADLDQAGKCIAFECPTAAAFHLLRGTESVLRAFYFKLVHQKRARVLTWGNIIQDLKTRRKAQQHKVPLQNLENIKNSFRNPTQHPELVYDIHEVQDLWGLCVDVINRMAQTLR